MATRSEKPGAQIALAGIADEGDDAFPLGFGTRSYLASGAQVITRHGKKTVVVLPFDEYERLIKQSDSLAQYLLASPLAGSGLVFERDQSLPRHIEIGS